MQLLNCLKHEDCNDTACSERIPNRFFACAITIAVHRYVPKKFIGINKRVKLRISYCFVFARLVAGPCGPGRDTLKRPRSPDPLAHAIEHCCLAAP